MELVFLISFNIKYYNEKMSFMAHRQLRLPYLYELRNSTTARVKYINIIFSRGRTNEIITVLFLWNIGNRI